MAHALAEPHARWADLGRRTTSALVLAPIALGAIWVGGLPFQLLALAIGVGLSWEWARLCRPQSSATSSWPRSQSSWPGLTRPSTPGPGHQARPPTLPLPTGLLFLWLAVIALVWLRADPQAGRANLLFLLAVIWATDIGAYAIGRTLGGPKLAPRISPGKTCSGAFGGLIAAAAIGLAAAAVTHTPLLPGAVIAAALSAIGQAGDLAESALKRRFGVKDSGTLIPGHGGLLDRLDSTLAVAIPAALLALLLGPGVVLWR